MAVKVEQQEYLFSRDGQIVGASIAQKPPFCMNYLHDLKSQWWAIMWILLYYTNKDSPSGNLYAQLECFNKVFPPAVAQTLHQFFFIASPPHQKAYNTLLTTYNT